MRLATVNGFDLLFIVGAIVLGVLAALQRWRIVEAEAAEIALTATLDECYRLMVDQYFGDELAVLRRAERLLSDRPHIFVSTGSGRCRICRGHLGSHVAEPQAERI